ncbi:MAG: 5-(carboxyamino)imidazole ribonucleotide synthase [Pseudomonadota bacterium]
MTRIGIIGAGQLGRMMALAAYPLGLKVRFVDTHADSPGGQVGDILIGALDDGDRLDELASVVDVVTFDVENVGAEHIDRLAAQRPFLPPPRALSIAQDRLNEKTCFTDLGIPTPRYRAVDTREDLDDAVSHVGIPLVLKTRRLGYDGRGQRVVRNEEELEDAFDALSGVPLIAESLIELEGEVSAIAVRSRGGEVRHYPLSFNVHEGGILRWSTAPHNDEALEKEALIYINKILEAVDYTGILTVEFFIENGRLLANEMAPRVHNSGHWTIEGAVTSQFENHIRAVAGLPLGATTPRGYSAMVNFLGQMPSAPDVLALNGTHLHDYGKSPRPGRKLGHATVNADSAAARDEKLKALLQLIEP